MVFFAFSFINMEVLPLFSELIVFLKVYVVNLNLLGMSWIFFVTCQMSPRCLGFSSLKVNIITNTTLSSFLMVQRDVWGLMCKCGSKVFFK